MKSNFYEALKPLLTISKMFGTISFTFTSRGYKISKFEIYFKVFFCTVYLAFFGYLVYVRKQFNYYSSMMTTTDIMRYAVSTLLAIIAWFFSARYQNKNITILKRLLGVDNEMRKLGVWIRYEKLTKLIYVQVVVRCIVLFIVIGYQSIFANYTAKTSLINAIMLLFISLLPVLINTVVCQEVSVYISILRDRFKILNKHLTSLQHSTNGLINDDIKIIKLTTFLGTKLKMLRVVCPIHHELTKIAEVINERFGIVLLMSFLGTFISTVVNLYFFSLLFRDKKVDDKIYTMLGTLISCGSYIAETVYVCHMCNTTVEEANNSAILLHKIETDDNEVKDQIEMFSLQIAHKRVEFSAAGLFPIDYTLLFSIIGGVTTNLVILIQFAVTP